MMFLHDLETFLGNHLAPAAEAERAQGYGEQVHAPQRSAFFIVVLSNSAEYQNFLCWREP